MSALLAVEPLTTERQGLADVAAHAVASNDASVRFFEAHADVIAHTCHAMAERFQHGGRLLVFGEGVTRSDVAHVVVEFVHPVIVGKRALPAVALPEVGARAALETVARPHDILLLLSAHALSDSATALHVEARARDLLVIVLSGGGDGGCEHGHERARGEFCFAVPSGDAAVVQEAHEMLYHVLWELVHVFLEHREVAHA